MDNRVRGMVRITRGGVLMDNERARGLTDGVSTELEEASCGVPGTS